MKPQAARDERTTTEKISDYFVNDGVKLVFIVLWFIGNVACFSERYYQYTKVRTDVFDILGHGLPMARGAAAAIKLNTALLLCTVLRNFLSFLRGTFLGSVLPVDKNIVFHRYIAWTTLFWTAVHIMAHMFNYNKFATADPTELDEVLGMAVPTQAALAYTTLAGTTGHLVTLIMVLMYSSAIKYIRSPMFNVFWFTHHLFILFFILLCFHGAGALLEPPTFWMWFIGPGFLYTIERTIRLLRGSQDTILQLAIAHPSKVLELQMKKSSFKYKSGQYLFLNCPYVANQEWHPFTISSAPEEEFVSVHIRIVGDWTGDLWNFLNPDKKLGVVQENLLSAPDGSPIFKIDGPYGAASEDVFNFKTVMCVAGGIGVTPFGSILKSIRYKIERHGQTQINKVYFYWISRDKNAFEWFSEVLAVLEYENINNFLEVHVYLTGQLSTDEIRNVMYGLDSEADQITGLQSPTHFGRPNWNEIFADIGARHAGTQIGVFFCGPAVLSKQLYKMATLYTNSKTGTRFVYHKENF
eukprot:TRINITY_DN3498_c0_g2_i1.p1 TRINITY_DN3498_c0_g2~~TRINITY_DN3498_c0_g2_i1.p1  ORF type:complete len:525 (+),score=130.81 TRINITY_DN3498_c0_g2_i1:127-1701(+)